MKIAKKAIPPNVTLVSSHQLPFLILGLINTMQLKNFLHHFC